MTKIYKRRQQSTLSVLRKGKVKYATLGRYMKKKKSAMIVLPVVHLNIKNTIFVFHLDFADQV